MSNQILKTQAFSVMNQWKFKTKIMLEKSTTSSKAMIALTTSTIIRAKSLGSSKNK